MSFCDMILYSYDFFFKYDEQSLFKIAIAIKHLSIYTIYIFVSFFLLTFHKMNYCIWATMYLQFKLRCIISSLTRNSFALDFHFGFVIWSITDFKRAKYTRTLVRYACRWIHIVKWIFMATIMSTNTRVNVLCSMCYNEWLNINHNDSTIRFFLLKVIMTHHPR